MIAWLVIVLKRVVRVLQRTFEKCVDAPAEDKPHCGDALAVRQVGPGVLNDQMGRQEDAHASYSEQCHKDRRRHGVGRIAGERDAQRVEWMKWLCAGAIDSVDYSVHHCDDCDLGEGLRDWR